jgi:hypothetical protein
VNCKYILDTPLWSCYNFRQHSGQYFHYIDMAGTLFSLQVDQKDRQSIHLHKIRIVALHNRLDILNKQFVRLGVECMLLGLGRGMVGSPGGFLSMHFHKILLDISHNYPQKYYGDKYIVQILGRKCLCDCYRSNEHILQMVLHFCE